MQVDFTLGEAIVLIDALKRTAVRQESESRFDPRNAGPHDKKAKACRALALKIEIAMAEKVAKAS